MTLKELSYVIETAKEMSFSKAAAKLFISQPTLSQTINKMERYLGTPLFVRSNKKIIEQTPACKLIVEKGTPILQMTDELEQLLNGLSNVKNRTLQVGVSSFFNRHYMPKIITAYKARYPGINLKIVDGSMQEMEEQVVAGKLDFCIISGPLENKTLQSEAVFNEETLFVMPNNHDLLDKVTLLNGEYYISLHYAKDANFVFVKKNRYSDFCMNLCKQEGFIPNISFESSRLDTLCSYIAADLGVGFVPDILLTSLSNRNSIVYCRIASPNINRSYIAAYKKRSMLCKASLDFIKTVKILYPYSTTYCDEQTDRRYFEDSTD